MSVYKPRKSPYWHFDFVFKGQRFHGSTGCSSKREAEAFERRERHKAANPDTRRPPITVDLACGLRQDAIGNKPSWRTARYMLAALIAGLGANRLLSEITQIEMQRHFAKRRAGRSDASINREIEEVRAVWICARKARFDVGEMPDWKALFLSVPKKPPRELSETTEEAPLFEALSDDAYDPVLFALLSGWRKAEVIGLRWTDVDLGRAEAVTKIKGGDVVVRPLSPALVAIIANQTKCGPFVFTYVCAKSKSAYTDKRGRKHPARRKGERYPMTVTALRTRWAEAKTAVKLQGFRFHDLRHTAATRILRATQNLALTKEALAHSRIETTLRYAHVLGDDVRKGLTAAQSRNIPELANRARRKG
jgi:integrase